MLMCQDTSVLLSVMKQELFKSSTCKVAKCMGRYKGLNMLHTNELLDGLDAQLLTNGIVLKHTT